MNKRAKTETSKTNKDDLVAVVLFSFNSKKNGTHCIPLYI